MADFTPQLNDALAHLKQDGVLLYPSDTIWGIGCDARSSKAVEAVYRLKQREDSKALICLVADRKMLATYVGEIPEALLPYLEEERPTTIIYPKVKGLSERLCAACHYRPYKQHLAKSSMPSSFARSVGMHLPISWIHHFNCFGIRLINDHIMM